MIDTVHGCELMGVSSVTSISHVKICSSSNGLNGIQRRNIEKPTQSKSNNVMSGGEIMKCFVFGFVFWGFFFYCFYFFSLKIL